MQSHRGFAAAGCEADKPREAAAEAGTSGKGKGKGKGKGTGKGRGKEGGKAAAKKPSTAGMKTYFDDLGREREVRRLGHGRRGECAYGT